MSIMASIVEKDQNSILMKNAKHALFYLRREIISKNLKEI